MFFALTLVKSQNLIPNAGFEYKSSIHICPSYRFEKICTDIGMYFSKEQIYLENNFRIKDVIPQVQSSLYSVFSDSTWHKIEGEFIAKGGEQYLIIGSFSKKPKTIDLKEGKRWYLYVDNVDTKPIMNTPRINPVAREIEDMDQIYFQVGSSELQDASYKQLDKIVKAMIENPEVNLKLTGHTDNSGNEGANKTLSLNRAKSIRNYIVANGVSQSRIKVEGAGS